LLITCKGNWKGNQIIPQEYIGYIKNQIPGGFPASTSSCKNDPCKTGSFGGSCNDGSTNDGRYGYNFWTYNEVYNQGILIPQDTITASGHGGETKLIIIPSLDIIAVGTNKGTTAWGSSTTDIGSSSFRNAVKLLADSVPQKVCSSQDICGNNIDDNCNNLIDETCQRSNGACDVYWSNVEWTGKNDTRGIFNVKDIYTDLKFVCYNNQFYECGWELTDSNLAIKSTNNQTVGSWTCNLTSRTWNNNSIIQRPISDEDEDEETNNLIENNDLDDLDLDGISNDIDKCPGTIPSSTINTLGCPLPRWTNFVNQSTDISRKNINKIYNFELKNNKGAIQFNESISLILNNNSIDLDSNIIIEQNKISIDTSKLSQFNKSAKLIFYNITSINPKVLRNGISCTDCKIISFENKVLTVEVPHFTTYEIIENSTILSDNSQNISNNDSIAPETTNPGNIEDTEDYLNSEIPLQQANEDDSDKLNISSEIKATKIKSSKIWIFLLIAIIILLIMGFIIFKILNKTDQKNKSTLTSSKQDKLQQ
jgi:hypothetical protein